MTENLRTRVLIRGHVQGVGFRWSAVKEATRLGLLGWIRNRRDGSVEAMAEGDNLDTFVMWCKKGPIGAQVKSIEVYSEEHDKPLNDFIILEDFE